MLRTIFTLVMMATFVAAQDVRPQETPRDSRKKLGIDNGITMWDSNKWDIYEARYGHVLAGKTLIIAHGVMGLPTELHGFIPNTPPGVYKCYPTENGPMMTRIR